MLWWIANAVILFVVVPLVILLANRVIRPAGEIQAYADDVLESVSISAGTGTRCPLSLTPCSSTSSAYA